MSYKEQRKKAGYSQKTVANLLGVSVSAVSLYETLRYSPKLAPPYQPREVPVSQIASTWYLPKSPSFSGRHSPSPHT